MLFSRIPHHFSMQPGHFTSFSGLLSARRNVRKSPAFFTSLGLLFVSAMAPFAQPAHAEVLVQAQGRCKLMSGGFETFNGHCSFKHKRSGAVNAYVVKLDDGTDFHFTGPNPQALSVQTYAGIRNVTHKGQPNHDVFSWNDGEPRRLSVRLDQVQNPNARFESSPQQATPGALLGSAVGALIGSLITGKPVATTEPARIGSPVTDLQSLVGVRGAGAEATLTSKGYIYRGGTKVADSSFTYWQQPNTNNCVAVRTTDGRYQAITYTQKSDCN